MPRTVGDDKVRPLPIGPHSPPRVPADVVMRTVSSMEARVDAIFKARCVEDTIKSKERQKKSIGSAENSSGANSVASNSARLSEHHTEVRSSNVPPLPPQLEGRTRTATWMGDLGPTVIGHVPLSLVKMVGTHNSGTANMGRSIEYHCVCGNNCDKDCRCLEANALGNKPLRFSAGTSSGGRQVLSGDGTAAIMSLPWGIRHLATTISFPWCRTQTLSLYEQLEAGYRYLDIRLIANEAPWLCEEGNFDVGELWVAHGMFSIPHRRVVNEVLSFARRYPKEIFILDYNRLLEMKEDMSDERGMGDDLERARTRHLRRREMLFGTVKDETKGEKLSKSEEKTLDRRQEAARLYNARKRREFLLSTRVMPCERQMEEESEIVLTTSVPPMRSIVSHHQEEASGGGAGFHSAEMGSPQGTGISDTGMGSPASSTPASAYLSTVNKFSAVSPAAPARAMTAAAFSSREVEPLTAAPPAVLSESPYALATQHTDLFEDDAFGCCAFSDETPLRRLLRDLQPLLPHIIPTFGPSAVDLSTVTMDELWRLAPTYVKEEGGGDNKVPTVSAIRSTIIVTFPENLTSWLQKGLLETRAFDPLVSSRGRRSAASQGEGEARAGGVPHRHAVIQKLPRFNDFSLINRSLRGGGLNRAEESPEVEDESAVRKEEDLAKESHETRNAVVSYMQSLFSGLLQSPATFTAASSSQPAPPPAMAENSATREPDGGKVELPQSPKTVGSRSEACDASPASQDDNNSIAFHSELRSEAAVVTTTVASPSLSLAREAFLDSAWHNRRTPLLLLGRMKEYLTRLTQKEFAHLLCIPPTTSAIVGSQGARNGAQKLLLSPPQKKTTTSTRLFVTGAIITITAKDVVRGILTGCLRCFAAPTVFFCCHRPKYDHKASVVSVMDGCDARGDDGLHLYTARSGSATSSDESHPPSAQQPFISKTNKKDAKNGETSDPPSAREMLAASALCTTAAADAPLANAFETSVDFGSSEANCCNNYLGAGIFYISRELNAHAMVFFRGMNTAFSAERWEILCSSAEAAFKEAMEIRRGMPAVCDRKQPHHHHRQVAASANDSELQLFNESFVNSDGYRELYRTYVLQQTSPANSDVTNVNSQIGKEEPDDNALRYSLAKEVFRHWGTLCSCEELKQDRPNTATTGDCCLWCRCNFDRNILQLDFPEDAILFMRRRSCPSSKAVPGVQWEESAVEMCLKHTIAQGLATAGTLY